MAESYVSQAEFGRQTGRSQQAVFKLVHSGKVPVVTRKGKKVIPLERAKAALGENLDPAQAHADDADRGSVRSGKVTYSEVRTAQMALKVQDQQIELARKRDSLIDKDGAVKRAFEFARGFRDAILNFPARYSAQIAADLGVDPGKVNTALDKRLKEYLADIADRRIGL